MERGTNLDSLREMTMNKYTHTLKTHCKRQFRLESWRKNNSKKISIKWIRRILNERFETEV